MTTAETIDHLLSIGGWEYEFANNGLFFYTFYTDRWTYKGGYIVYDAPVHEIGFDGVMKKYFEDNNLSNEQALSALAEMIGVILVIDPYHIPSNDWLKKIC